MRGFNYKKAVQSLSFLANENGGTLNKMKAIKLIWLADRLHLRQFGRSITGDEYYALQNGPVPSGTRDVLENSDFLDDTASDYASEYLSAIDKYNFAILTKPNLKVFSETDIKTLKTIFLKFRMQSNDNCKKISSRDCMWKCCKSQFSYRSF
jgi:hypothetical protein